jgi:hypothetical protein
MGRRRDKLELFWVMSDALTSTDDNERDRALLVLQALYADQNRERRQAIMRPHKVEYRKLALAVWGQLHEAGLLRPKRHAYAVYVRDIIDGVAWFLEKKELAQARKDYAHLSGRAGGSTKLTRDQRGPLQSVMFVLDGLTTREVMSPDGV